MSPQNKEIAIAYAKAEFPREACGLVIIEKGHEVFVPCKNISEFDDQFEINPIDYMQAEERGEIVEIFHSHPIGSPAPSEPDLVSCEKTGLKWSIVSPGKEIWTEFEPKGYRAPLVGRQWAHGLLDCYSLIVDYHDQVLNIKIPDFERSFEWWHKGQDLYVENFEKAGFIEVAHEQIKTHDVILMKFQSPVINHGGIYLGDEKFLHHMHRRLSSRDVYGGFWARHTLKVVRHKDLF